MQVHKVKTLYSNSYVVVEGDALFVVDVAMRCDGFVLNFIETVLARSIHDVTLVVCTHDDPDHIGGVVALAKSCQAQSAIPHASKRPRLKLARNPLGPIVKVGTALREAFRARAREMYLNPSRKLKYAHVHNHHLDSLHTQKYRLPKSRLTDGMQLPGFQNWQVIHTPGHSWDSICFYHAATKSLITGDTLLGSGTKGHVVHPAIYDNPMDMRRTLRRLKGLQPETIYPGHGTVFSGIELLDHL